MKYFSGIIEIVLLSLTITLSGYSQENQSGINFFLDCEDCDLTFIRQELTFISFVRDPLLADVHILVTDSRTGSGGHKFFLNFIGKDKFTGINNEYDIITDQSDTDDDIRKTLLKTLKVGILQYYSRTGFIERLNINIEDTENKKADELIIDPWNKWIFRIESGGEFQKEESQNRYSFANEARIQKITEEWKGSIEALYEFNRENYYDDGTLITNKQNTREISARYIKSLTSKWSARIYGEYLSRTYLNIDHKFETSLAAEYNIFPWNESHRRIIAFRYNLALASYNYIEETIYDKMNETLLSESLEIQIELIQPWGEISLGLEGRHLFQDFSKNRLTLESDFSIRLSKHFSVFCEIQSDMIHDQLYLPKGDISLEDLLLNRRKLATTYEVSGQLGFRFTFGSIFNNVVNERF
jgi:hypothetical protein